MFLKGQNVSKTYNILIFTVPEVTTAAATLMCVFQDRVDLCQEISVCCLLCSTVWRELLPQVTHTTDKNYLK